MNPSGLGPYMESFAFVPALDPILLPPPCLLLSVLWSRVLTCRYQVGLAREDNDENIAPECLLLPEEPKPYAFLLLLGQVAGTSRHMVLRLYSNTNRLEKGSLGAQASGQPHLPNLPPLFHV